MKKILCFLSFIFFEFVQNVNLNKQFIGNNLLEIDDRDKKDIKYRKNNPGLDVNGHTCIILSAKEGDLKNCWCPRGYIMCNEEDVKDVQNKLAQIKDKDERKKATPSWLQRLCDDSTKQGFKDVSVVIDYELAVICKENDKKYPDFKIIGASGFITLEELRQKQKESSIYTFRKCTVNDFYLCRKVKNDNINCSYSPWSKWDTCTDKKQRRSKKVIRSNQNNENFCLWENKLIPGNIIEETRSCE